MVTKDSDNVRLRQGGLKITASVNYKETDELNTLHNSVPVNVVDNQNGTYMIKFKLEVKGVIVINISVEDCLIKVNKKTGPQRMSPIK